MDSNHKLCLYVSYYLSRFNELAYKNLGYSTMNEAHSEIGKILNTNPHTVKNMRDQFDPLHGHRVGWYQEPLSPSRVKIVEALQYLSEIEIREIVSDILSGRINNNEDEKENLLSVISSNDETPKNKVFILRGPTGRKAEEYFISQYTGKKLPIDGILIDQRDFGVGYDFKMTKSGDEYYFEVKGLSEVAGGILFTSKEWQVAKEKGDAFFLVIVSDLNNDEPLIQFIQNPAKKFSPKKNITKTIQINWSVSQKEIENFFSS